METVLEDIKEKLLSLKEEAIQATKRGDATFYANYLADDAIAVVPFGVFTKDDIVKQMASANSAFKSSRIEDTKAVVLSPDSGIVTYRAIYSITKNGVAGESTVFVTTVYSKIDGEWKGVFYQQTPLQQAKSQAEKSLSHDQ